MTLASAGMAALAPTATILLPCTTTSPGELRLPLRPSNRCAALSTVVAAGVCAWAAKASDKATARVAVRRFMQVFPKLGVSPECMPIGRVGNCGPPGGGCERLGWYYFVETRCTRALGDESIRLDGGARLPARTDRIGAGGAGDVV